MRGTGTSSPRSPRESPRDDPVAGAPLLVGHAVTVGELADVALRYDDLVQRWVALMPAVLVDPAEPRWPEFEALTAEVTAARDALLLATELRLVCGCTAEHTCYQHGMAQRIRRVGRRAA